MPDGNRPASRRVRVPLAALLAGTAACAASPGPGGHTESTTPGTSAPGTSAPGITTGVLTGEVKLYGGPMTRNRTMALNGAPGPSVKVTVRVGGHAVASVLTGRDGRFLLLLRPGRYTVSACGQRATLSVRAGETVAHDIPCPVP